jgi:hypothetical protein
MPEEITAVNGTIVTTDPVVLLVEDAFEACLAAMGKASDLNAPVGDEWFPVITDLLAFVRFSLDTWPDNEKVHEAMCDAFENIEYEVEVLRGKIMAATGIQDIVDSVVKKVPRG